MTYVDGLPGVLSQVSQIQTAMASASSAVPGGFESVLAQVSSISQLVGEPPAPAPVLPGPPDLSGSFGWPLDEGSDVLPAGATVPSPQAAGPQVQATEPRVTVYDERTVQPATPGAAFYGDLEQAATSSGVTGQAVVADAQKYLGVPYLWGGTDPAQGLDCSGLVQDVYGDVGISLPRTSQEQATVGVPVSSLAEAQPGDLVFFPGSDGTASAPGHVGIYIGDGEMIDAPHTGADVRVEPVGNPTAVRRVTGLGATGPGGTVTGASATTYGTSGPSSPQGSSATSGPSSTEDADFAAAATTYGVPENLLKAVASTESSFQPGAISGAGAEGLMQLMPAVASSLGVNPFNPGQSISAAAQLLSSYHDRFGSWSLALAAYNAGPGAVQEYSGIPPYAQTTAYVSSVLTAAGMAD
jgi:cell wall-associated NlpC family hydrolase